MASYPGNKDPGVPSSDKGMHMATTTSPTAPTSDEGEIQKGNASESLDPRALLAEWANKSDEWVRFLVTEIIAGGKQVDATTVEKAYQLFRQEKALDERDLPAIPLLAVNPRQDESAPPLVLTRLSDVRGVNALVSSSAIEPHDNLTILYGENGTGKTGYSRIFKALANSRTADTILSNIEMDSTDDQGATLDYRLAGADKSLAWNGERGVAPFTRMSIFDSPSVTTHVDDDLDYVYVPLALALFTHVTAAIQSLAARVDSEITTLNARNSGLLRLFQRGSSIYPFIETLGASTDLDELKIHTKSGEQSEAELDTLTQSVAALRANTIATQIAAQRAEKRVLDQASAAMQTLLAFKVTEYNAAVVKRLQLSNDYQKFRDELFGATDLPAEPDETWESFIVAGDIYRQHLVEVQAHDLDRCLYCRQNLEDSSRSLLARYSAYLEDKISADILDTDQILAELKMEFCNLKNADIGAFIDQYGEAEERPPYYAHVMLIEDIRSRAADAITNGRPVAIDTDLLSVAKTDLNTALTAIDTNIDSLEVQQRNRAEVLAEKQAELLEWKDSVELGKSWQLIETQVQTAKEADRLRTLRRPMTQMARSITALAKSASDALVNQSFDRLFLEECEALRAQPMKLQFVGRDGKAQRRKIMTGKHRPSKVLSEGEQKVLALADFLAEARLAGITAPVIFDDPVSSLDHRRVNEVAQRITQLADSNQVIVFTHDILFATTLVSLSEKSKKCALFHIVDEGGPKGQVTRATGLRTDSLKAIRGRINNTIQAATSQQGEVRDALVRTAYSHVRAWCEVFTEDELLKGVTKRYRANVQMTTLPSINGGKLDIIGPKVAAIFELACRYIDGHSQPLATLGVSPTLTGVEQHWAELQELKRANES